MLNRDLALTYGVIILACCRDKSIICLISDSERWNKENSKMELMGTLKSLRFYWIYILTYSDVWCASRELIWPSWLSFLRCEKWDECYIISGMFWRVNDMYSKHLAQCLAYDRAFIQHRSIVHYLPRIPLGMSKTLVITATILASWSVYPGVEDGQQTNL